MKRMLARPALCAVLLLALGGCSSFGPGWQSSALDPNSRLPVYADPVAAPATLEDRCSAEAWRAAAAYPQARESAYIHAHRRCMEAAQKANAGK